MDVALVGTGFLETRGHLLEALSDAFRHLDRAPDEAGDTLGKLIGELPSDIIELFGLRARDDALRLVGLYGGYQRLAVRMSHKSLHSPSVVLQTLLEDIASLL